MASNSTQTWQNLGIRKLFKLQRGASRNWCLKQCVKQKIVPVKLVIETLHLRLVIILFWITKSAANWNLQIPIQSAYVTQAEHQHFLSEMGVEPTFVMWKCEGSNSCHTAWQSKHDQDEVDLGGLGLFALRSGQFNSYHFCTWYKWSDCPYPSVVPGVASEIVKERKTVVSTTVGSLDMAKKH